MVTKSSWENETLFFQLSEKQGLKRGSLFKVSDEVLVLRTRNDKCGICIQVLDHPQTFTRQQI